MLLIIHFLLFYLKFSFCYSNIFTSRSYAHLRTVFDQYQQKYSHSMEKVIGSEFSGNIKKTLISIVKYVNNPSEFIAEQ